MAIYFSALLVCERCDAELKMDDVSSESEVDQRLHASESAWSEDENGDLVCGACWEKWEQTQATTEPSTGAHRE
jgi:hypothetical protein